MRIIAGKLKGSTLHIPKNKNTRPLKDIARESIFNLLIHSKKIKIILEKSKVLDLYAGTGSFGLECLSRQAKSVFFVEKNNDALEILKKNVEKLNVKNKIKIFDNDIFDLVNNKKKIDTQFNIIFCDPPFKDTNINQLIELIYDNNLLSKDGILILHRDKSTKDLMPKYFKVIDERIYGISKIIFGNFLA